MQKSFTKEEKELARIILIYLARHPAAKDTLKGISEWWITHEYIDHTVDMIKNALDYLVKLEFIRYDYHSLNSPSYQINHDKKNEILKLLAAKQKLEKESS